MKFREYLDEAKLNKSSYLHNGAPSQEITARVSDFDEDKGELGIWVNGGSAYRFGISKKAAENLRELGYKELNKIGESIALKVAKLIDVEINKIEKKYNN